MLRISEQGRVIVMLAGGRNALLCRRHSIPAALGKCNWQRARFAAPPFATAPR